MDKKHDAIAFAASLIFKAVIIAAKYSGRVRKRSLKRLATMDIDEKDKENIFLKDKVYQLEMQVSILQKRIQKRQKKPRLGAVGKHGSISVTERVIKTLKYEWLKRVPIIKGFDHLTMLCEEYENWYNSWRPHMTLDGIRPDDVYYDKKTKKPKRDSKTVPCHIEQHLFQETRIMGYRLKAVA